MTSGNPARSRELAWLFALAGLLAGTAVSNAFPFFLGPLLKAGLVDLAPAPSSGWSSFTVTKPASREDQDEIRRKPDARLLLPPDHESLRVGLGVGFIPGVDQGSELTVTGSAGGVQMAAAALLTSGPRGFDLYSGHALLEDPDHGWGGEAGDLASPLWGFARGLRYLRLHPDDGDRDAGALSVYLGDARTPVGRTLFAYRDDLRLGSSTTVGGEISSDGSWLARTLFAGRRFRLFAYRRENRGRISNSGTGFSGSLELPGGWMLQGGAGRSGAGRLSLANRDLSLRVPLGAAAVTLEGTEATTSSSRNRVGGLSVELPLGRSWLLARYQRRQGDLLGLPGRGFRWVHDQGLLNVSRAAGRRLRWEAQLTASQSSLGDPEFWGQIQVSLALSRATSLALLAAGGTYPGTGVFRVRLDHEICPGFSFFAEYGDVPTFQPTVEERSGHRFKLMVRRAWDVDTPARGGTVEGRVTDGTSRSPAGVPVQLGPYRTVTRDDGRYAFQNVPRGRYELRVPEEELPAGYGDPAVTPTVVVASRGRQERDLAVSALGEARGRICMDRDGDGWCGPGEGVSGVVVHLDERVTQSGDTGEFGFFNLSPGSHRLWLDGARLPAGMAVTVPSSMQLGLPPGRSIDGITLYLIERRKPVVFQEVRR
jgi:hypothetical protein